MKNTNTEVPGAQTAVRTSHIAAVTVNPPVPAASPTILVDPYDETVYAGDIVTLSVAATKSDERTIALPEGVDPSKLTTGIVTEPDGAVRHVPTKVTVIDGRYYAQINSLTNSMYTVIWHPLTFQDVEHHWAQQDVNDMGSRLVVNGVGDEQFNPDADITRAEVATIVKRLLKESGLI